MLVLFSFAVQAKDSFNYFVAGVYANKDSESTLNVLNPSEGSAEVEVRIYYEKNDSGSMRFTVDPHSTKSVNISRFASGSFGMVISSENGLVIDTVEIDKSYPGGWSSLAETKSAFVWYFGEGYSSGMVKTYLNLLNPSPRESNIGVTLYYENGEKKTFNVNLAAHKNTRIDLKEKTLAEKRFGIKVTSTVPIVASTANFNKRFKAGSGSHGLRELSKSFVFPDGYTSDEATEFINMVNPSLGVAHLNITFYYTDGTTTRIDDIIQPNSKKMILVNNYVSDMKWYSTVIDSDVDIAADSTHYDSSYSAGYGGYGAATSSEDHYFAYGIVDSMKKSYIAVFNPSEKEADMTTTFYYADGTVKELKSKAPSMMRSTIDLTGAAIDNKPFGVHIKSTEGIVAKMIIFDRSNSAAYGYIGMQEIPGTEKFDMTLQDELDADQEEGSESVDFRLLKEEKVEPSRFKEELRIGLLDATKRSYDADGSTAVSWVLRYSGKASADDAYRSAVSGGFFELLEVSPDSLAGNDVHSFIADKAEGYIWIDKDAVYLFLASRGNRDIAKGLAEKVMSSDATAKSSMGLSKILAIIFVLISLVFIVRWLFRRNGEDEDEKAVWEDVIPSAKPRKKASKRKKNAVDKKHPAPEKKAEHRKEHEVKKEAVAKKEVKVRNHEKMHAPKKEEKTENKAAVKKEISIREIPRDKVTAQDLLDDAGNIPDYEDVFKHVNRDYEEIKPK